MKYLLYTIYFLFTTSLVSAQVIKSGETPVFNHQDSLRGSITPERAWWDLKHYRLEALVQPENQSIDGSNTITYEVLKAGQVMQIDLQPPMDIKKVTQKGKELEFKRDGNAYFITLDKKQKEGKTEEITIYYGGKPRVAKNPPWDGGLTWSKDANGKDFIATSCQGEGASMFWPCKDHMYDEPDNGMDIIVTVPEDLVEVSNGRLIEVKENKFEKTKAYHWQVTNPINNYGVNINIGDYVNFSEQYNGEKGELDCNYYVLRDNLSKAKEQFKDATRMLEAFEYWFGPYPFYEDSYKLVEVPYLGMEHQSSVTYGNGYSNGYRGRDLSLSGWGMKFDFIIIHESGHEWFANNITYKDIADMWIHESFTAYSETLFLEYFYSKEAANEYVLGTRSSILNDRPIIGYYDVNYSGSGDMYYKGANMLHTLRQLFNDDNKWRSALRGMNEKYYHATVTTEEIENYLSEQLGKDLKPFFDQYLRTVEIPILQYRLMGNTLLCKWSNTVEDFNMPVKLYVNGKETWVEAETHWTPTTNIPENAEIKVDKNFYIATLNIMGN
ncbi:M1 family metallopeptidase [Fulvivirga ligni]|uniref:M1 family metallopeptidase n=1 Tax=Fulvivirga ligni TaxID=2904246 RepID=UPI001F1B8593|nr:M1 family metallopeptidase [Fulvivirga ligni]UII23110.1 M1 family metallopeptidase [Fulvivirga ligni]